MYSGWPGLQFLFKKRGFASVYFTKEELADIQVRDVLGDGNCLAFALAVTFLAMKTSSKE
jgi:hypothetical protein